MKKILLLFCLVQSFLLYSQKNTIQTQTIKTTTTTTIKTFNKPGGDPDITYIDSTQTIIYDFKTKEYIKSNVKPRVGEPLVFKIKNINRLAYDVTIKSDDAAILDEYFKDGFETAVKKTGDETGKNEASTPKTITDTKLSKDALTTAGQDKITKPDDNANKILSISKSIVKDEYSIDSLKTEKQKRIDLIKTYTIKLDFFQDSIKTIKPEDSKTAIENSLKKALNEKISIQNKIDSLLSASIAKKNDIISISNAVDAVEKTFDQLSQLYSEILYESQKMRAIDESYQNFHQSALNPLLKYELYETYSKDQKFILYQLPQYRSQINDFDKSINNFINFYNQAINNWEIFDAIKLVEAKDNIRIKYQLYKEEVDKIKTSVDALNISTKLRKVEAIHAILKEEKAYEITSSPIQPLEDYVTFDVTIKNRDLTKSAEYDDNREFTYMEYTRGGIRFDFSTGIVVNFIGNNDKYELANVEGDATHKKIILTDNNQFTPTLAGMFHTSFRSNGIWAFGLTLGASVNVETFELGSLFPGVSLLIGKKQKFIISAGPAFRQVEELKSNYEENGIYNSADFNDDTQLTSKQFKLGFFCGITYNLTQKQRAKFKIGSN